MVNFFICLIISLMTSIGLSILLVEKGKDFPVKKFRILLQCVLRKIHWKLPQMLYCTTCTSFWATLVIDFFLCIFFYSIFGVFYFFWPFSGFIACGITWSLIEFLNAIDKEPNINVFVDK